MSSLESYLASSAGGSLFLPRDVVGRFHRAVIDSPLVVLSGVSGSGKTSLALGYVRWRTSGSDGPGYRIVTVGAGWRDSTVLLGRYDDATHSYVSTACVEMILSALRQPSHTFYMIIDGADLADPRSYGSHLFLAMDGRIPIELHGQSRCIPRHGVSRDEAALICHDPCDKCFFVNPMVRPGRLPSTMSAVVPPRMRIPPNFRLIMTLQSEEWTGGMAPMVVDRARFVALPSADVVTWLDGPGGIRGHDRARQFIRSLGAVAARHDLDVGWRGIVRVMTALERSEQVDSPVGRQLDESPMAGELGDDAEQAEPLAAGELDQLDQLDELVDGCILPRLHVVVRGKPGLRRELAALCADAGLLRSSRRIARVAEGDG